MPGKSNMATVHSDTRLERFASVVMKLQKGAQGRTRILRIAGGRLVVNIRKAEEGLSSANTTNRLSAIKNPLILRWLAGRVGRLSDSDGDLCRVDLLADRRMLRLLFTAPERTAWPDSKGKC